MEVLAAVAWAISGAIVARGRGFDFMGVFIIAIVASTGGGLLRDGLFLQRTPVLVTNPLYLVVPFLAMVVISLFGGIWERLVWWDKLVNVIDAIGTPAFALLGFQLSILSGVPFVGALFIGLDNGVAGGILRDVLVGEVPQLFRPGQYTGTIAIAALLLYSALLSYANVDSNAAAWVSLLVAAVLRLLVINFNWQTQAVNEWRVEKELARLPREAAKIYQRTTRHDGDKTGDEGESRKDATD
jgi:uncharacterized membrane protein YeiH